MKLIAMTLIKNQQSNIIQWLRNCKLAGVDKHIFLDNNSTDSTVQLIKDFSKNNDYKILLESSDDDFSKNEQLLRNKLYKLVRKIANDGDWILAIDSDEYIDKKEFSEFKKKYLINNNIDANSFSFNLLDMWDKNMFRSDGLWSPSRAIYLFKYENKPYAKN